MIFKITIALLITLNQIAANESSNEFGSESEIGQLSPQLSKELKVKFLNTTHDLQLKNFENVRIIKTNARIFLLNGIDLYEWKVASKLEGKSLEQIAKLKDLSNSTIFDVKASSWSEYVIFVVALDTYYNVYVVASEGSKDLLSPIERLPKQGMRSNIEFFQLNGRLYCAIVNAMSVGDESSTMYFYKWRKSHFTRIETISMETIDNFFVYTTGSTALIATVDYFLNRKSSNAVLNVYILDDDEKLRHVQMLYLDAVNVFPATMRDTLYFYTVSHGGLLTSYQWDTEHFVQFLDYKDLKNSTKLTSRDDLIFSQSSEHFLVYANPKLLSPYEMPSNYSTNLKDIVVSKTNGRVYVTFFNQISNDLSITSTEAEFGDVNENLGQTRDSPIDCLINIRDNQRSQIPAIEAIKNMLPLIYYKDKNLDIDSELHVKTLSIGGKAKIRRINVNDANMKVSMKELTDGITNVLIKLKKLKTLKKRHKRNTDNTSGKSLNVTTINVKRLNIPKKLFEKFLIKKNGTAIYKGRLTTDTLTANSIKFKGTLEPNVGTIFPIQHTKIDGIKRIVDLQVKSINGINWNDFYSSIYLKNSPQPIEGDLMISEGSRIKHLNVQSINEFSVDKFFTLNTNQEILSDIFITAFHATNISANRINGIDFGNDVAKLNEDNVIETPVRILQAQIGNLTLADSDNDEIITRHIVGTRVEDLSQIYNGKVVIKGSLKLSNVFLDVIKTKVFVNEQKFRLNVAEDFWMKSVDQQLGNVRWTSLISAPQLFTTLINNFPTENLIVVDATPKKPVNLIFQKAFVQGNVYGDSEFETKLSRISKECVRRGSSTRISGKKTFAGLLSVNDLVGQFDDLPTSDSFVLNNSDEKKFYWNCTKKFESIIVNGNVEYGGVSLVITRLNGINLVEFFENAIRINQPTRLEGLRLGNIRATNLTVGIINNHSFTELAAVIEGSLGENGHVNSVHINGNVNILGNLFVGSINDINFDNYLGLVVTSLSGGQIGGVKRFLAGLSVVNLNVRRINSIDFDYWFENALNKYGEQFINQNWILNTVSIGEINANMINGVNTKELIDLSAERIEIRSDISTNSVRVLGNLNGVMQCNVNDLNNVLEKGLTKPKWNFVDVFGYVEWPEEQGSPINEIIKFAMTGNDQVITGDTFFANITFVDQVQSTGIINNIDIKNIFEDCLVKNSTTQIIKGSNIFKQPINVGNFAVEKHLQVPFINDVNVVQLNNSIFRLVDGNIVSGIKTFAKPPIIGDMYFDGTINETPINDIVFANSSTVLPPIRFYQPIMIQEQLTIVKNINGINYNYLIDQIIRKTGSSQEITGLITFQNLVVQGDAKISYINGVYINDIVLKSSDSIQEILDHKTITGDVYLDGPAVITKINGLEVVDAYSNSLFLDQNLVVRRLEIMGDVIVEKGLTIKTEFNGMSIIPLINWQLPSKTDLIPIWLNVVNTMNKAEQLLYQNYGKSFHILYLDYAPNIKVKFEANNNLPVSFIIDTVDSGELCGLDTKCECPSQYDISLSPLQQIYINRRPYFDRIIKMFGSNCNITVKTIFLNKCLSSTHFETTIEWSAHSGSGKLTTNEPIFGVKLYDVERDTFMLMNQLNGSIVVMKLDQQANNWFSSDIIIGNNVHIDILEWKLFKVVIILSKPSIVKSHDVAQFWFYNANVGRQGFEMFQEIPGEYNLCSKIYMEQDDKFVLFLGKTESKFISIFMVHWAAEFQLFQTLALDSGIKTFVAFKVDDWYCLVVVTTNGYLYLYKYNNIEGWLPISYGFFKDIESIIPFKQFNKIYLFVAMKNAATVISVYSQGLH